MTRATKKAIAPAIRKILLELEGLSSTKAPGTWPKLAPHRVQKLASSLFSFPHLVQKWSSAPLSARGAFPGGSQMLICLLISFTCGRAPDIG